MKPSQAGNVREACQGVLDLVDQIWLHLPLGADEVVPAVRQLLGNPPDLIVRTLSPEVKLLFLESIVDPRRIEEALVRPLVRRSEDGATTYAAHVSPLFTFGQTIRALLQARIVLLGPGRRALAVAMERWPGRAPQEPSAEIVPQGPHLGFVEVLQTNMALLRHRIPDPKLRWEAFEVGQRARLHGALLYMEDLVRPGVLDRLRRALRRARLPFATDASMLQEWLTNVSGVLFPTMDSTERPDVAAAALLEGRVVLLIDGSPVALMAPTVFAHLIQVPQDYYNRSFDVTLKRAMRFFALMTSLILAPLFVAVTTVNQELIPAPVYVSVAQSRLATPLPMVAEILAMEVVVELVREAGLRMPGAVGQTISIVGAIVIGQAAVIAGLVSASVVVIVSFEYIASTVVASLDARLTLRMLRFPLIILASIFGIFGLFWGLMLVLLYLVALESFGVPYLAPLAPLRTRGLQDTIWRRPVTDLLPSFLSRRRR